VPSLTVVRNDIYARFCHVAYNKGSALAEIARRINLKFAPDIRFRIDDRFAEAERIDKLLRSPDVKRDLSNSEDSE
jgi:ribosome-binding factor A